MAWEQKEQEKLEQSTLEQQVIVDLGEGGVGDGFKDPGAVDNSWHGSRRKRRRSRCGRPWSSK